MLNDLLYGVRDGGGKLLKMRSFVALSAAVFALTACQASEGGDAQMNSPQSSQQPSQEASSDSMTVTGSVLMTAGGPRGLEWNNGIDESGSEWLCLGYGPMAVGSQVLLLDGQGATVGLGEITAAGKVANQQLVEAASTQVDIEPICAFPFVVEQVQPGRGFYTFQAGQFSSLVIAEADLQGEVDWEPAEGS